MTRKNSPFEERKKFCPFSQLNSPKINYKDVSNYYQGTYLKKEK